MEVREEEERSFAYLSLVTDAYTHEIVGWALHDSLDTEGPLRALKMAIAQYGGYGLNGLIHHSDRGCQYCSQEYVNMLKQYDIQISMTDKGDPYENAIAERVNGIIKNEWLNQLRLASLDMARGTIKNIVGIYNEKRPHMSLGMMTPMQARFQAGEMKKLWKNYWALKQIRQQPAGEEGPCPEPPAAGRVVTAAPDYRAAAVPQ